MKRTPLHRSTTRLKRTRMNPQSAKTRTRIAAHREQRKAWLERFTNCMACGKPMNGEIHGPSVHEIYGGTAMRQITFGMPSMWLALCHPCNEAAGSVPDRPRFIAQLVIKITKDAPHFDLAEANRIWTRNGAEPVTISELRDYLDAEENHRGGGIAGGFSP